MSNQEPTSEDPAWGTPLEADEAFSETVPWQEMSPELYAARNGHRIYCYSYEMMLFRDPGLDRWARRFGEIWQDEAELTRVRREYLTAEEYRQVLREIVKCKREMDRLKQEALEAEEEEDTSDG